MPQNAAERRRWNDSYWTCVWPRREQLTSSVTDYLIGHLAPTAGERILDVGSGGGSATFAIAADVGPEGSVVGADISGQLVELSRTRAAERGAANVTFVLADVQDSPVAGVPFDAVASQFGVMFFDEPVRAFANLAAQSRPGARLVFVCWQEAARNRWNVGPALAAFAAPVAPPEPGKSPTGPFTLADPGHTAGLLEAGGWTDVENHPYQVDAVVERRAVFDEGELEFRGVPAADRDAAVRAVDDQLGPLTTEDGRIVAPLAFQVFRARRS